MNKYPWLPIWVKKVIWFCFYKPRGHKWLLPGPTSTSHPFGWISHDCTNNECKNNMTESQLNKFYHGQPAHECAECNRRQVLMNQAAEHIEKQQKLNDVLASALELSKERIEKVENERTQFCDMYNKAKHAEEELKKWWHAERDDAEKLRKENKQLLELNSNLEHRIEIMGG